MYNFLFITSILCVKLSLKFFHFGVDLLLTLPVLGLSQGHGTAQGAKLVGRDVLLVFFGLVPYQGVLIMIGDTDLGADDHH